MRADLLTAIRSLRRSPLFAITAIATLALGIGATTAIFSIVHAVLLQPLPYSEPERLVRIWEANPAEGTERAAVAAANFNDWRAQANAFSDLALFTVIIDPTVVGIRNLSVQATQAVVTTNLFDLLGVQPALGRPFGAVPAARGPLDPTEVIVSDAFWQRAFGGDPAAIGAEVRIEGAGGRVVVGVMPSGFSYPEGTDVWTPMASTGAAAARRDLRMHGAIGRLAANVSVAGAQAQLDAVARSLANDYPDSNRGWTVTVLPLHEAVTGQHRLALITLLAAVSFVLLVGCANVSNLLLARGVGRRGELAVRAALGADRSRLLRLLLAETAVLAAASIAAGIACARLLLPVLIRLGGDNVPRLADAHIAPITIAFAALVTCAATLVAGLIPALRHSRADIGSATVADGERATRPRFDARVQRLIVAAELAICLMLLVGATLFAQTFARLRAVDLGFDPEQVFSIETRVPIYRSLARDRWQQLASQTSEALERVRTLPGVVAASTTSDLPLAGNLLTTEITLPGRSETRQAFYHRVSPDYFRTMGMTLVEGRDFTAADMSDLARLPDPRAIVPRTGAVIVNETTARMLWPSGNAVGQFLATSFDARATATREVVGVVRDARSESLRGAPPAEVYVPYLEDPSFVLTLLVRSALPPEQIAPMVRREVQAVSGDLSTAEVSLLTDVVGDALREPRFSAFVVSAFAGTALFLSALGVFGVFAVGVAARTREIGIRMALGATRGVIGRMFIGQAVAPILWGVALGTLGSLALGRLVGSLLYGVTPTHAPSYAAATALLVLVALAATYLPVRRALRIDPARTLRG